MQGLLGDGVCITLEDIKAVRQSSRLAVLFTAELLREVCVDNLVASDKLLLFNP